MKGKGVELEQSWGEGETGLETQQFLDSAIPARAELKFCPFLAKLCPQFRHTLPLDSERGLDQARADLRHSWGCVFLIVSR